MYTPVGHSRIGHRTSFYCSPYMPGAWQGMLVGQLSFPFMYSTTAFLWASSLCSRRIL